MVPTAARHDLSDWLALHDLDPSLCERLLDAAARRFAREPTDDGEFASETCAFDRETAWLRAVEALCAFFPWASGTIRFAFENTSRILVKEARHRRRAVTLNDAGNGFPLILYTYRGTASDWIVIAHEFGHALQAVASEGRFVAPAIREVCAFVGEITLISHMRILGDDRSLRLQRAWARDDLKYLGTDREELESVLSRPDSPYRYSWNYPIARYLSIEICQKMAREHVWAVFEGKVQMQKILSKITI
ncbi:hypothetical protein MesoLjLb_29650 [Mesorhizobium sp. L-8-3]|nr:hypothetical protein MesoLjLb_29650 [Mesorhizobium sp. L-8-3]